ncbi:MAG: hypothetical protein M3535_05230 [Actinomycetota bacterium]|jgi:lipoate-protein ligase A|nr:hypothetical protein [Actinomycetota bacterium]
MGSAWAVEWEVGEAAAFHARSLSEPAVRAVSVIEVARPALVLGSTQPATDVAAPALEAAGVALVRRRSGGGAVLLVPGGSLWVDVVLPRGDIVWDDDVGRAAHWLGQAWRAALADLGVDGAEVHTGGLVTSRWSSLVCFAGVGPGEVCAGGRKAVGISQRRSRSGARFQCLLLRRWDPVPLLGLLTLDPVDQQRGGVELAGVAVGLDLPSSEVVDALVAHLPS